MVHFGHSEKHLSNSKNNLRRLYIFIQSVIKKFTVGMMKEIRATSLALCFLFRESNNNEMQGITAQYYTVSIFIL